MFPTVLALAFTTAIEPAGATCALARLIGGCAGSCKYILVEGNPPSSELQGSFWGWGGGDPQMGVGDDNGTDAAIGNDDPGIDWVKSYDGQYYLAGAWSNALVDGCVDEATTPSPKRTVVLLSDRTPTRSYFAVYCQVADASANYDFSVTSGDHTLVAIPRSRITSRTRGPELVTFGLASPSGQALADGTHPLDASCAALLRGYRLYTLILPVEISFPPDLRTSSWVRQGGEVPIGQPTSLGYVSGFCVPGSSLWLASSIVFESGFETPFVSEPRLISCDPFLADRPGDFKLIRRPGETERPRQ